MNERISLGVAGTDEARGMVARLWKKPDTFIVTAIFLSSLVLHVLTSARTVTFSDSGDFLMAIAGTGNCHGPGYPLFIIVSKLFSRVFPVGSLAFRVSVLSGLFASLAGCLIYLSVFRMTRSRIGGAVAAAAFLFSYTFWYQTVIPETYGLNVFFFTLLLALMLRWERQLGEGHRKSADNTLALFALVFGLALTNHFSALFLLPAFLFFAVDTEARAVFNAKNLLRMGAFFAIGLLPYVYQPTAAFRGPYYNYGDPSTPLNWYRHVTLYYLRGGLFGYPLRFFGGRFLRYFATLTTEYPYYFWLAAVGLVASFLQRSRKYALFLALFFMFTALPVMMYDQLESVLRAHFYYPSYLGIALWIGFGAAFLAKLVSRWAIKRDRLVSATAIGLIGLVLVALACVSIPVHYSRVDKSNYYYARDMATKMLEKASPDGIILTDSDNVLFPCKYMQFVEGVGKDVRVVNPRSLGVPGWTSTDLDRQVEAPGSDIKPGDPPYLRITRQHYGKVGVYSSALVFDFFGHNQQWEGLLLRILPPGAPHPGSRPAVLARGTEPIENLDSDAREALMLPNAMLAYANLNVNDTRGAETLYRRIAAFGARELYVPTLYGCETFYNVYDLWGQVLNRLGRYKENVRVMPGAFLFNPDFVSLPYAHALSQTGNDRAALGALQDYLTVHPGSATAHAEQGEILLVRGDFPAAAESFRAAIELEDTGVEVHYNLAIALIQMNKRTGAIRELETVVRGGAGTSWEQRAREILDSLENKRPPVKDESPPAHRSP